MARTALTLTVEEQRSYQPDKRVGHIDTLARWKKAREVARLAASLLRDRFGVTRVVAFGSVTRAAWFTPWSDVDLVAWDIPADQFYRATALVAGLSPDFEIDLLAAEDCRPGLRRVIEREGVEL